MKTEIVYDEKEIERRIEALGERISSDYAGEPLVCVCVLKGAFMFFAELVKHIRGEVYIDFIRLCSYDGARSSGEVKLHNDLSISVADKNVLIVEDIVDSGRTLEFLRTHFDSKGARSVKVACLLDRPKNREVMQEVDYKCFTLETSAFLVGYGLDYDQLFRNRADIAEVKFE